MIEGTNKYLQLIDKYNNWMLSACSIVLLFLLANFTNFIIKNDAKMGIFPHNLVFIFIILMLILAIVFFTYAKDHIGMANQKYYDIKKSEKYFKIIKNFRYKNIQDSSDAINDKDMIENKDRVLNEYISRYIFYEVEDYINLFEKLNNLHAYGKIVFTGGLIAFALYFIRFIAEYNNTSISNVSLSG